GLVHVIYGTGARLSAAGNQIWHQRLSGRETPSLLGNAASNDRFGGALPGAPFGGGAAGFSGMWSDVSQRCVGKTHCHLSARLLVNNPGTAAAGRSVVQVFLSADATLGTDDTLLDEGTFGPLAAGATRQLPVELELDASAGGMFLI